MLELLSCWVAGPQELNADMSPVDMTGMTHKESGILIGSPGTRSSPRVHEALVRSESLTGRYEVAVSTWVPPRGLQALACLHRMEENTLRDYFAARQQCPKPRAFRPSAKDFYAADLKTLVPETQLARILQPESSDAGLQRHCGLESANSRISVSAGSTSESYPELI